MPATEVLHHRSTLTSAARLLHKLGVLHLSSLLEGQMGFLLPLFVDGIGVFGHQLLLADFLSWFIASFLDNFAFTVYFLQGVALLGLVPLHDSLAFGVHVLVVWNQIQCHIIKERTFMLIPQA